MTQRVLIVVACLICADLPLRVNAACRYPATTCEELTKADLVFIAEVVEATIVPRRDDQGRPYPDGITN